MPYIYTPDEVVIRKSDAIAIKRLLEYIQMKGFDARKHRDEPTNQTERTARNITESIKTLRRAL
jgi:hypothetical protein